MMDKISFIPAVGAKYRYDYGAVCAEINRCVEKDDKVKYARLLREFCKQDLFFLLYFILRVPVNHPWLVERIKDVEDQDDRTLDLWFREGFKSTIITYGRNIQDILKNPEERIAIFSHTRGIAKSFFRRIKQTFESNENLKAIFPDVLYEKPESQAPKWSEDDGLTVKRKGVYQEATVESWGVVDGMPTSKHFTIRNYDDVVTRESVTTPEQIKKTQECFELSHSLGVSGGKVRIIGTRYHFNDLYSVLKDSGNWLTRIHPITKDGTPEGEPVLLTREQVAQQRRDDGPYVFATQKLLNPVASEMQVFNYDWLQFYRTVPAVVNKYMLVDPAHSKKRGSDYTVLWVWGIDGLGNYYCLDIVRDKLNLTERWEVVRDKVQEHGIREIGYERYGLQADKEHFEHMMKEEGVYFIVIELGGALGKEDRIKRLIPIAEQKRFYLPEVLMYKGRDLVKEFINEEYLTFPFSQHDDMLDAASRICDEDMSVVIPTLTPKPELPSYGSEMGWML